jgi:hypothetical protein
MSDLDKYSYYFYNYTDCKIVNNQKICRVIGATGFLIKKGNNLYLVSAAHSFFDLQHEGQEPLKYDYPRQFNLRVYPKNSNVPETITVDVSKQHPPTNYFYSHPDVYFVKIDIPKKYQVYSVEETFTKRSKDYEKTKEGIMFGYPETGAFNINRPPDSAIFETSTYLDSVNIVEYKTENQAALKQTSGTAITKGFSGAPMFLLLPNSKIIFGGVCIATNSMKTIFIRPSFVLSEMPKD